MRIGDVLCSRGFVAHFNVLHRGYTNTKSTFCRAYQPCVHQVRVSRTSWRASRCCRCRRRMRLLYIRVLPLVSGTCGGNLSSPVLPPSSTRLAPFVSLAPVSAPGLLSDPGCVLVTWSCSSSSSATRVRTRVRSYGDWSFVGVEHPEGFEHPGFGAHLEALEHGGVTPSSPTARACICCISAAYLRDHNHVTPPRLAPLLRPLATPPFLESRTRMSRPLTTPPSTRVLWINYTMTVLHIRSLCSRKLLFSVYISMTTGKQPL